MKKIAASGIIALLILGIGGVQAYPSQVPVDVKVQEILAIGTNAQEYIASQADPCSPYWEAPGYENVKSVVDRILDPEKYWAEHHELYAAPVITYTEEIKLKGEIIQNEIAANADPGPPYWEQPGYEVIKAVVEKTIDPEKFWAEHNAKYQTIIDAKIQEILSKGRI